MVRVRVRYEGGVDGRVGVPSRTELALEKGGLVAHVGLGCVWEGIKNGVGRGGKRRAV